MSEDQNRLNGALRSMPVLQFEINMMGLPMEYEAPLIKDALRKAGIEIAEKYLKSELKELELDKIGSHFGGGRRKITYEGRFILLTETQIRELMTRIISKANAELAIDAAESEKRIMFSLLKTLAETSSLNIDNINDNY